MHSCSVGLRPIRTHYGSIFLASRPTCGPGYCQMLACSNGATWIAPIARFYCDESGESMVTRSAVIGP